MDSYNLKLIIYQWFNYESEDEENRPEWIQKKVDNYRNGRWIIGKENCE